MINNKMYISETLTFVCSRCRYEFITDRYVPMAGNNAETECENPECRHRFMQRRVKPLKYPNLGSLSPDVPPKVALDVSKPLQDTTKYIAQPHIMKVVSKSKKNLALLIGKRINPTWAQIMDLFCRGYTPQEISDKTGVKKGYVQQSLGRCKTQLLGHNVMSLHSIDTFRRLAALGLYIDVDKMEAKKQIEYKTRANTRRVNTYARKTNKIQEMSGFTPSNGIDKLEELRKRSSLI